MAYKEVEIPESDGASYFKFNAIGEIFEGRFISSALGSPGQYGAKMEYRFKTREGVQVLNPPTRLAQGLEIAIADGRLKPGIKIKAVYKSNRDVGKEYPMKEFQLLISDDPPVTATTSKPVETPAQKMARMKAELAALEAPAADDSDIPF